MTQYDTRTQMIRDIAQSLRTRAWNEAHREFRFKDATVDILSQSVQDIGNNVSQLLVHLTPGTRTYNVALDTLEVVQYRSMNTEEKVRRVLLKLVDRFDSMLEAIDDDRL